MQKGKIIKSVLIVSLFSCFLTTLGSINAESTLSKYNKELQEVREKEKENSRKLTGIQKDIAEYNYEIADLDDKMMEATSDLADLQMKKENLNKSIIEKEKSLQNSTKLYNNVEKTYEDMLRTVYENGFPSIFEFLVSSKNVIDFITKMNTYQNVLEYNKDIVTNAKSKKNYINYVKKNIEKQKNEITQLENDVNKKIDSLNKTLEEKQKFMNELKNSQSVLQANSEELVNQRKEALKKIDDEIEKAYRASLNTNNNQGNIGAATEFTGGNFAWPAPGYNTITTTFGFVYYLVNPSGSAHTGCDIAGANIFGKPIVAAESGTVIVAGYNAGGYGNYVMIDHGKCTQDGNNYITLYGHASALAVQKGDKVTKGQTIAYVGSTGNSTGPHLHFEMRINGKITDPLVQYPSLSFDYR